MRRVLTISAIAGAFVLLLAGPALAHGEYDHGDIAVATGFQTEPAYVGQPNAVELEISKAGKPVTDVGQGDLKVGVSFGGQSTTLTLQPNFEVGEWGTPGNYIASFIPTQPGKYTFDIAGTVAGEQVTYSMTSGPDTFSEVEDPASAMFPPVDAPSNADLNTKLDAASARTDTSIASAHDAADTARTVAIVAFIVAVIAIVLAIVAWRRRGTTTA
ncbi:MAG TPA: hypothetical protein VJ736_11310 [Actinomycetota bacterium]|nr:hypothetical protein [Actinomycetota bacterium]